MRISVESNSPDFSDLVYSIDRVYCNGEPLDRCVAFDDEEGWADVLVRGPHIGNGAHILHTERKTGTITWTIKATDAD